MLILDIIVLALIALGAFSGHKKGLVGILVSFAGLILSIILAFAFQSVVAEALCNSGIGDSVTKMIEGNMEKMIDNGENMEDSLYAKILSSNITNDQVNQAAKNLTMFIMKGLSFIVIFLAVYIICYILQMVLNLVFNLPILSSINGIGGTIVGGLSVLIKIWIVLAILSFISPLPMFSSIMNYIDKTVITKFLYNTNFVVSIIQSGLKL